MEFIYVFHTFGCLLIKTAGNQSIYKFWELLINPNGEIFNVKFLALRICLLSALGCKTIKLKELLKGALYSNDMDVDVHVVIPNYNDVCTYNLNNYILLPIMIII